MKKIGLAALVLCALILMSDPLSASKNQSISPEAAVQKLIEGNNRYAIGKPERPHQNQDRRNEVAQGQSPFAIIVTCSDSRVPPEILFDQGLGDLFIIRTAGNVIDDSALGSIEYAAEHLGVQLILVLGHERCGAVDATVKGGEAPGHIKELVKYIEPAVKKSREKKGGDLLENSIHENVLMTVEKIIESRPVLNELYEKKKIKAVGAYYDLDSGTVQFLEEKKEKEEKKEDIVIDK
ncbi:MAG TPA: carbonic anhydrase [Candidatus Wallbacteria bacterium]|nr:carbonic anhydrase [Candidatus Wallbacteria bacterium]